MHFKLTNNIFYSQVKGLSYSMLSGTQNRIKYSKGQLETYERIWDVADLVVPPSEANAFFVMTNAIITPNQTRSTCPEDHTEIPNVICEISFLDSGKKSARECRKGHISYYTSHGSETGQCVKHDRNEIIEDVNVCEISGWCPVEQDALLMREAPLIPNTEFFTVLIKNAISFPIFDSENYYRNNMPNGICIFDPRKEESWTCPIFRLGDIIGLAGGNKYGLMRNKSILDF